MPVIYFCVALLFFSDFLDPNPNYKRIFETYVMCMDILFVMYCMCNICVQCLQRAVELIVSPGNRIINGCGLPCVC